MEAAAKKKRKIMIWTAAVLCIAALGALLGVKLYRDHQEKITPVFNDEIKLETGIDALPAPIQYFSYTGSIEAVNVWLEYTDEAGNPADYLTQAEGVVAAPPGRYEVTLSGGGLKELHKAVLLLTDTTPPSLTLKDVSIPYGGTYSLDDFIEDCTDNSGQACAMAFSMPKAGEDVDYTAFQEPGRHTVSIDAIDSYGNLVTAQAALTIGEKPAGR